jgi:hypothetical protein
MEWLRRAPRTARASAESVCDLRPAVLQTPETRVCNSAQHPFQPDPTHELIQPILTHPNKPVLEPNLKNSFPPNPLALQCGSAASGSGSATLVFDVCLCLFWTRLFLYLMFLFFFKRRPWASHTLFIY